MTGVYELAREVLKLAQRGGLPDAVRSYTNLEYDCDAADTRVTIKLYDVESNLLYSWAPSVEVSRRCMDRGEAYTQDYLTQNDPDVFTAAQPTVKDRIELARQRVAALSSELSAAWAQLDELLRAQ